jgi:hypothetical protein
MADAISLQVDADTLNGIEMFLRESGPAAALAAGAVVLNKAAESARSAMVNAVATDLGVKPADVKKYIRTRQADAGHLEARVYAWGKRGIALVNLSASGPDPSRGKGSGVTVSANPGSFPRAFLARMPRSGHRGVFERAGTNRLPIRELFTRPIPEVFGRLRSAGVARAVQVLSTEAAGEIKSALAGLA